MTFIILVRHGSTSWGEDGNRYNGTSDISLSDIGRRQATLTAHALANRSLTAIYASPLSRAGETASIIAAPHFLPVEIEPDLIELDFGRWEGLRKVDIQTSDVTGWTTWLQNPDDTRVGSTGDTGRDAVRRARAAVDRIAARHVADTIAIVAHNTLLRLMITDSLGAPLRSYRNLELSNCGICLLEVTDHSLWKWHTLNSTTHLQMADT